MTDADGHDGIVRFTWIIPFLGLLTTLGPLSNDLYVPSLTLVAAGLSTDGGAVQLTMSSLLIGFALGSLIYGPLSDRYGRKPMLCAGLAVYVAAAVLSAVSTTLTGLVAARALQGLGAAAAMVLTRAIILDRWTGEQASRAMSWVAMFMFLSPVLAPTIGGWVASFEHWPAVFWIQAAIGVTCGLVAWAALPRVYRLRETTLAQSIGAYGVILRDTQALGYMACTGLGFIGLVAFVSNSAFVFVERFGLTPARYGLLFSLIMLAASGGAFLNGRYVTQLGIPRMISFGTVFLAVGGAATMLSAALGGGLAALVPSIMIYVFGIGFVFANALARTMSRFRENAGATSSLFGFNQFMIGGFVAAGLSLIETPTPVPLGATLAVAGLGCAAVWWAWLRRVPAFAEQADEP